MKKIYATLICFAFLANAHAQTFTSFFTGDTTDMVTNQLPGLVLAGGGGDNDDAMKWMLERADGGDVVVIRASGSDGYNEYFFAELGVNVNSVETILFHSVEAANDPYVIGQIENAEVLFIAGGDQSEYHDYWKDNAVEDAINFLLNEKMVTVGGTSAGMAILGNGYYAALNNSATSETVLAQPFHPNLHGLNHGDFLENPLLPAVVTDTHFDQRDRAGRLMVFVAHLALFLEDQYFAIACNEVTAVCVDENGTARVFGEHPEYPDYAYFLKTNCQDEPLPEVLEPGVPVTWNRGQAAVKALRIPGTVSGENTFDIDNWEQTNSGEWFDWYIEESELFQLANADPACDAFTTEVWESEENDWSFELSPNPVSEAFVIEIQGGTSGEMDFEIYSSFGKIVRSGVLAAGQNKVDVNDFAAGAYLIRVKNGEEFGVLRFLKM